MIRIGPFCLWSGARSTRCLRIATHARGTLCPCSFLRAPSTFLCVAFAGQPLWLTPPLRRRGLHCPAEAGQTKLSTCVRRETRSPDHASLTAASKARAFAQSLLSPRTTAGVRLRARGVKHCSPDHDLRSCGEVRVVHRASIAPPSVAHSIIYG